jgi:antirestriction protein
MPVINREEIVEQIENADKSYAVLSIYATNYHLNLADWESFADDAEQTYLGRFDSARTFAEDYAERIGFLNGKDEVLIKYFNFDHWASDLFKEGAVWEDEGHYFQMM